MKRTDDTFVGDIIIAAASISDYVRGVSKASFLHNDEKRDAIIRQVGIIGEAASKLSATFREAHPTIAWRTIIGMRNIVIHQYWEVDLDVVWDVAKRDIPTLVKQLDDPAVVVAESGRRKKHAAKGNRER